MAGAGGMFGVGASIGGGFQQAAAARASGDAQAQAYEYNAKIAENNAMMAKKSALADAIQQNRINAARHGKMVTQIIKQGVALDSGTPLLLLAEDAAQGELEKQKVLYKGDVQAYNYNSQATLNRYYAEQATTAADNTANAAITGGILGGVKGMFGMFGGK